MNFPFLDLRKINKQLESEFQSALSQVINNDWLILGESVSTFESSFAKYTSSRHCVSVANGLDALYLILKALDIGPGDEVIVPAHTFVATWLSVSKIGATIVPAEPANGTHNVALSTIRSLVTSKTKAIIIVHLYGHPVCCEEVVDFCRSESIYLIEDSAQAHGASYKGKKVGSYGIASAWSFYPGKNLGALGDGGAITTSDNELAAKLTTLRNYGSSAKYVHDQLGENSRLDSLQAAFLAIKLKYLDYNNKIRSDGASIYLSSINNPFIKLPLVHPDSVPVWHLFVIESDYREELIQYLGSRGVQTLIHYPTPPHKQKCYQLDFNLPITEHLSRRILSIPIGPHLLPEDYYSISDIVNQFQPSNS